MRRSDQACSGAGNCECDELDPDAVAKCVCNENYSGDVCQDFNEPEAAIGVIKPAYEEPMIADTSDENDDDEGVEFVSEGRSEDEGLGQMCYEETLL